MQQAIRLSQTQAKAKTMSQVLDTSNEFIPRHIGPSEDDQQKMLAAIGAADLATLMREVARLRAENRTLRDIVNREASSAQYNPLGVLA